MDKIKWGIIGCGDVTEVKSGPAFQKVPDSELVAVMRRNASKAEDYARRHGVPRWYDEAEKLITDPEVNAIYIATPPASHEAYAIRSLAAGKPVYLEKPMAIDFTSAQRIEEAARKGNYKLTIAHYRRRQPYFLKIKEILDSGKIGKIRMVHLRFFQEHKSKMIAQTEENWRLNPAISGGGLFHDLAPHQLDLMVYFFGVPVFSNGVALNSSRFYEADDVVSGQVIFENEILFSGAWCFTAHQGLEMDDCLVIGSEGSLRFSVFKKQIIHLVSDGKEEEIAFEAPAHVQQPMIEATVRYFLGKGENPCSAEDALISMKMMEGFTG